MAQNIPKIQIQDEKLLQTTYTDVNNPDTSESSNLTSWKQACLPSKDEKVSSARTIEKHLRDNEVVHPDNPEKLFWPEALFNHIFDRSAVDDIVKG
jgi:hypothetical protein